MKMAFNLQDFPTKNWMYVPANIATLANGQTSKNHFMMVVNHDDNYMPVFNALERFSHEISAIQIR